MHIHRTVVRAPNAAAPQHQESALTLAAGKRVRYCRQFLEAPEPRIDFATRREAGVSCLCDQLISFCLAFLGKSVFASVFI
jgi:hypothetical protein